MLQLRVARPTADLDALVAQYRDGLGLRLLGSFADHGGFDGAMLGEPGGPYHLEFTREAGAATDPPPSPEHLLVFYVPDEAEWAARCERMLAAGFEAVAAHNPYWERAGRTFADRDGYRVVLARGAWR